MATFITSHFIIPVNVRTRTNQFDFNFTGRQAHYKVFAIKGLWCKKEKIRDLKNNMFEIQNKVEDKQDL